MCLDDRPNNAVISVAAAMIKHHFVEIWSGRNGEVRTATESWLEAHHVPYDRLRMRPTIQPDLPDDVLKHGWLRMMRRTRHGDPFIVFDDRQKVVDMWRSEGVTCCQVAPGDF
jgi:hypothetical protein